jgi:hypothetical protein
MKEALSDGRFFLMLKKELIFNGNNKLPILTILQRPVRTKDNGKKSS